MAEEKNGDSNVDKGNANASRPSLQEEKIILLVDHSPVTRKQVKDLLKDADFEVIDACDARECLKKLAVQPAIDLGLIDIEMPNINGIQLLKMIHRQPVYTDLPAIMISSSPEKNVILQALKAGARDCLVKPIDQKTLLLKICKLLNMELKELPES